MKGIAALLLAVGTLTMAAATLAGGSSAERAHLAKQLGINSTDVVVSPIPGLYRITIGPQIAYVSADGRYLVRGDIINLQSGDNLTAVQRDAARLTYLKQLGPASMLVFAPPHPKQTLTVFTDIDCHYCRVLEHDRPKLNAMGIAVQYVFFPRDGRGSPSWQKAVDVWCAADRKAAFAAAMNGVSLKPAHCDAAAVAAGYTFGQMLGLDGTPAMLTDTGRLIDGYLPPPALAAVLAQQSKSAPTDEP
ncbi:MAG: thioredoxin fold domain-containing protein [Gammaproteobacteria bacterium]|nr:thioredoxin fold domain-containing protein [Gammaproteobacteria bacterium]MDE2140235.1 thioredoxin fold domain-containing protein [Gammaproteobacteria bacterium]